MLQVSTAITDVYVKAVAASPEIDVLIRSNVATVQVFERQTLSRSRSGVKQTFPLALHMSAFDPKRTYAETLPI
jgi:hypothetical protein